MRVSCVSSCGGSVVVKLPDEIDELEGYDAEKVQERNEVRTCCYFLSRLVFIDLTWTRSETDHASIGAKLVDEYVKRLSDGHRESCPWRNKGCDGLF